jgi:hypothetical protein
MSRYTIAAHDPRYDIVVGWDNRLETFFCQVFDTTVDTEDEAACVLWEGTALQAIPTVDALQTYLGPFTTIPEAMGAQLRCDQTQAIRRTPFQEMMLRLVQ